MNQHLTILSPSGAIDPAYIDGATRRLRSWGFDIREGVHTRDKHGRFAAPDDLRLADLRAALADPACDAILCARGGYGLQRIIDQVPPITKPIIGFSDITCLHLLAAAQGTPSLHALMCKHIATLPDDAAPLRYLRQALSAEPLRYTLPPHPLNRPGDVQTTILGGNLSVLYGLQGTPYGLTALLPSLPAKPLLFIEDIAEHHYHIDRMLHSFRLAGVFDHIAGLIIGQFADCQDDSSMGCTLCETIRALVEPYSFPLLFDFPAGHVDHNLPLWFSTPAHLTITPTASSLTIASPDLSHHP